MSTEVTYRLFKLETHPGSSNSAPGWRSKSIGLLDKAFCEFRCCNVYCNKQVKELQTEDMLFIKSLVHSHVCRIGMQHRRFTNRRLAKVCLDNHPLQVTQHSRSVNPKVLLVAGESEASFRLKPPKHRWKRGSAQRNSPGAPAKPLD